MADPARPSKTQLVLECLQRELTYLPMAASFLLAWFAPDWGPTWLIAPTLFTAGGAHFFYDFFLGQDVRGQLEARATKKEEQAQLADDARIMQGLPEEDREALVAVRALEKALIEKIRENQTVLELSGMFAHTYEQMAHQLAGSAVAALRRKGALLATARQLAQLKAKREAQELADKLPRLDRRVLEVRQSLRESLTQVALMEDEKGQLELASISTSLNEQLKLAGEIARDVADSGSFKRSVAEGAAEPLSADQPEPEPPPPDVLVIDDSQPPEGRKARRRER